jgi:hypothetical protein
MSMREFHPLCEFFPPMSDAAFEALVSDIKANGLREKIDLYEGKIIDGRNRFLALRRLGIDPFAEPNKYFRKAIYAHRIGGEIAPHEQSNDDRVRAYVISKNIHRRHLTAEQKRELIAKLLKATPEKSKNSIAKQVKADDKTVASVRRDMEARSEIPNVGTRTDSKGREQPARKSPVSRANATPPAVSKLDTSNRNDIGPASTGELARKDAEINELRNAKRLFEIKIKGLEAEIEDLKRENADLRQKLEAATARAASANNDGLDIPECLRRTSSAAPGGRK